MLQKFFILCLVFFLIPSCNLKREKSALFFTIGSTEQIPEIPTTEAQAPIPPSDEQNPSLVISASSLTLTEGSSTSYTIQVSLAISETLVVNFTCSQTYIPCPSSLSFDSSNWNTPQTVTLSLAHDSTITGIRTMQIQHSFTYKSQTQSSQIVDLTILDIDSANIIFNPTSPTPQIKEGTVTDSYTVVLTSAPSSNVTITLSFDSSKLMSINGNSSGTYTLTFTPVNYNIPQTLLFASPFDTGLGNRTVTVSYNVSSSDVNYNAFSLSNVTVNIEGNSGGSVGWGSFQSGIVNAGFSSHSVTLSPAVDPAKAYVYCNFEYSSSSPNTAATCQLNPTGTQVIIQTGGGTWVKVNWYVVEMETGLKVERGSTTFVTGEDIKNVTLTNSFYLQSSFVILYTRTNNTNHSNDAERLVKGKLLNSTTLELTRDKSNTAGMNVTVEWQVIELAGAKVVSGSTNITPMQTTKTVTLPDTVNLSKSFLIFNTSANSSVNGEEQNYYVRGRFASSNSLTFARDGNSGKVEINYFAVELVDSSTVQSGSGLFIGATSTTGVASLSPAVVTTRSMVVFSNSTAGSDISFQDSGTFSVLFNSSPVANQVQFTRFNHENHTCTIDWFVIEFPP